MSVERETRRALWRVVFWRLVGELVASPQIITRCIGSVMQIITTWLKQVEMAVFYMELDAARRYKLLTGVDLGTAAGEVSRYSGLNVEASEQMQERFLRSETGDDDDDD